MLWPEVTAGVLGLPVVIITINPTKDGAHPRLSTSTPQVTAGHHSPAYFLPGDLRWPQTRTWIKCWLVTVAICLKQCMLLCIFETISRLKRRQSKIRKLPLSFGWSSSVETPHTVVQPLLYYATFRQPRQIPIHVLSTMVYYLMSE